MVNSYQILNPIKSNVTYLLLENQDATLKSRIEKELDDYHNNNKFTIKDITEDIKETISVSNKFIFKKGYFFCSYIYKDISQEGVENIYISKPIYKNSDKPYCPKGEFSSIIIKNKIPLNLNIIGVIYYYKYVKNDDECVPDNLGYMTEESQITHNDNEKYVIDILYFNLLNKIDYELKYLFFKNVNYHDLKQLDYRKKLNYIEFKFKKNPNLIALSDNIEKNIFQETNQLILLINKTKKRLSIINAFSKTTNKLEKQLLVIAKQNMINDKLDCNTNKFDNYLVTCLDIKLYITKIIKDINKVITNINNVENIYSEVSNILYLFGTEKTASGDIREIGIGKSFTDNVLFDADRGNMEIIVKRRSTINKLKSNVIKLLDNIKTHVKMPNDKIRQLRIEVNDVKIDENNDYITELFNIIQNYQEFNKNIDIINDGNDINPIKIFLNYIDESSSDILKTEILDKYKSKLSNEIDDNYSIKSLPETLTLIINIDIFKINKDNINNLFNKCDALYEYLDKKDNIDFPTLYDIYFKTKYV